MDSPVFSVIVTAYNQPDDIKRAVESVLNQTVKCFELIVVDDCSTDNTPDVLKALSENHPEMKVIRHSKNASSHAARCTGVENASGRYVIFLDGDDYLCLGALEKLLTQVIQPLNDDFDVCEYSYICKPSGEVIKPAEWNETKPRIDYYLRHDAIVTVWNKLYKKEILQTAFKNMTPAYIRCGDDTYETICIAYFTKKFIQKDIVITNYQLDTGVSMRMNTFESNLRHCASLKTSYKSLIEFFDNNDYEHKTIIKKIVEERFFYWILSVMEKNTKIEDITHSLILLPKYFSDRLVEEEFRKLYKNKLKKKQIKLYIKNIIKK